MFSKQWSFQVLEHIAKSVCYSRALDATFSVLRIITANFMRMVSRQKRRRTVSWGQSCLCGVAGGKLKLLLACQQECLKKPLWVFSATSSSSVAGRECFCYMPFSSSFHRKQGTLLVSCIFLEW